MKTLRYLYTSVNRKLKSKGRYNGAAAVLVHLQRRSARQFVMTTANVGDVEVVLCRQGEAICLTRKFITSADRTECQRICKLDGFITAASVLSGRLICALIKHSALTLIMAALRSNADIIFLPCGFFLLLSSFIPRLISAVADWMSTILLHMVWP